MRLKESDDCRKHRYQSAVAVLCVVLLGWAYPGASSASSASPKQASEAIFPVLSINFVSQRGFQDGSMLHVDVRADRMHTASNLIRDLPEICMMPPCHAPELAIRLLVNNSMWKRWIMIPWEIIMETGVYEASFSLYGMASGLTTLEAVLVSPQHEILNSECVPYSLLIANTNDSASEESPYWISDRPYDLFTPGGAPALEILRVTRTEVELQVSWLEHSCTNFAVRVVVDSIPAFDGTANQSSCGRRDWPLTQPRYRIPIQALAAGQHTVSAQFSLAGTVLSDSLTVTIGNEDEDRSLAERPRRVFPGCTPTGQNVSNATLCTFWKQQVATRAFSDKSPPPRIQFLHIPKTGTSFLTVLRNSMEACETRSFPCFDNLWAQKTLRPDSSFRARVRAASRGEAVKEWESVQEDASVRRADAALTEEVLDAMEGLGTCKKHLVGCVHAFHQDYAAASLQYPNHSKVTMLRNPVKREISYVYFSEETRHRMKDEEILTWLRRHVHLCRLGVMWCEEFAGPNLQTRLLGGGHSHSHADVHDRMLRIAMKRLNEILFFGITDRWGESVCLFHCEIGGLPDPSDFQNTYNPTHSTRRHSPGPELEQALRERNSLDVMLFEAATRVFDLRVERCGCQPAAGRG